MLPTGDPAVYRAYLHYRAALRRVQVLVRSERETYAVERYLRMRRASPASAGQRQQAGDHTRAGAGRDERRAG
jgi:hypothetical protein